MIYKLLKIVISIIIFPIIIILFSTAALFTTIIIQLIMDIPVDDINALVYTGKIFKEMLLGGTLAWICVSFMLFSGRKRLNRFAIVFLGLTFVALVAYKAIHNIEPPFEYIGASMEKIEDIALSGDSQTSILITIKDEARPCHILTAHRDLFLTINRTDNSPVHFGVAAPEMEEEKVILEIKAVMPDGTSMPVLQTSALAADQWNDFTIPADSLASGIKTLRMILKVRPEDHTKTHLVFVSGPHVGNPGALPNIILICVDTMRADHVNMDTASFFHEIRKRSVFFTRAVAPCSWTLPSVAGILTGLLPHQHGYPSDMDLFNKEDVITIPEHLKRSGYITTASSSNILIDPKSGLGRGFDYFISIGRKQKTCLNSGRILTLRTIEWIEKNKDYPFFIYMHYMDPHHPYLAAGPDMFGTGGGGIISRLRSFYSFLRFDKTLSDDWIKKHPEEIPGVIARYDGEISYWDRQFASLMGYLDGEGLLENTLVVVTSDHGEAFGEHGNYRHGNSLYEEEIHVPLLIYEGRNPKGVEVEVPVSTTEIGAIISSLAGIPAAGSWKGRAMEDFLQDDPGSTKRPVFSELVSRNMFARTAEEQEAEVWFAARKNLKKLILHYLSETDSTNFELYYLDIDPHEIRNNWPDKKDQASDLHELIIKDLPDPAALSVPPRSIFPDEKINDLKALGYIK